MSSAKQNSPIYTTNSNSSYTNGHDRVERSPSFEDTYEEHAPLDINSYAKIMREHTLKQIEKAKRMNRSRRSDNGPVAVLGTEASMESTATA